MREASAQTTAAEVTMTMETVGTDVQETTRVDSTTMEGRMQNSYISRHFLNKIVFVHLMAKPSFACYGQIRALHET